MCVCVAHVSPYVVEVGTLWSWLSFYLSMGSEELSSDGQTYRSAPAPRVPLSSPKVLSDTDIHIFYELDETSHQPTGLFLLHCPLPLCLLSEGDWLPFHTCKPLAFPRLSSGVHL